MYGSDDIYAGDEGLDMSHGLVPSFGEIAEDIGDEMFGRRGRGGGGRGRARPRPLRRAFRAGRAFQGRGRGPGRGRGRVRGRGLGQGGNSEYWQMVGGSPAWQAGMVPGQDGGGGGYADEGEDDGYLEAMADDLLADDDAYDGDGYDEGYGEYDEEDEDEEDDEDDEFGRRGRGRVRGRGKRRGFKGGFRRRHPVMAAFNQGRKKRKRRQRRRRSNYRENQYEQNQDRAPLTVSRRPLTYDDEQDFQLDQYDDSYGNDGIVKVYAPPTRTDTLMDSAVIGFGAGLGIVGAFTIANLVGRAFR